MFGVETVRNLHHSVFIGSGVVNVGIYSNVCLHSSLVTHPTFVTVITTRRRQDMTTGLQDL